LADRSHRSKGCPHQRDSTLELAVWSCDGRVRRGVRGGWPMSWRSGSARAGQAPRESAVRHGLIDPSWQRARAGGPPGVALRVRHCAPLRRTLRWLLEPLGRHDHPDRLVGPLGVVGPHRLIEPALRRPHAREHRRPCRCGSAAWRRTLGVARGQSGAAAADANGVVRVNWQARLPRRSGRRLQHHVHVGAEVMQFYGGAELLRPPCENAPDRFASAGFRFSARGRIGGPTCTRLSEIDRSGGVADPALSATAQLRGDEPARFAPGASDVRTEFYQRRGERPRGAFWCR
jgi:hypothetical protein